MGRRELSDHCLISLKEADLARGPKPFKFFNCWLRHPGFRKLVEEWWQELHVTGCKMYILTEKLKLLRSKLRVWHREVFNSKDNVLEDELKELDVMDESLCCGQDIDTQERKKLATK